MCDVVGALGAPEDQPEEGTQPAVLFRHHDPKHPVVFGGWFGELRAPTVMMKAQAGALVDYLLEDPEGPFAGGVDPWPSGSDEDRWSQWGFTEDWSMPVLKADWHTVPQLSQDTQLFLPRYGWSERIKRAPPRVLGFMEAFREANAGCWSALLEELEGLKQATAKETWATEVVDDLCRCIREHRHFGVAEVQVWWGREGMKMASHKDGVASLLHLGLTLGGCRVMRVGGFASEDAEGNVGKDGVEVSESHERDVWTAGEWNRGKLVDVWLGPGDTYISSPFAIEHGVWYDEGTRDDPVINLMFRFAFDRDIGGDVNNLRDDVMNSIVHAISDALIVSLNRRELRMPTLREVVEAEARIDAHPTTE